MDSGNAALRAELEAIKGSREAISPDDVLEWAKANPASEIYRRYDDQGLWDDSQAAHKARISFAGMLIRKVRYRVQSADGRPANVRYMVSTTAARSQPKSYRLRQEILSDDERRQQLLDDCGRDLESIARKYADVLTASQLRAIRAVVSGVKKSRAAVNGQLRLAAAAEK